MRERAEQQSQQSRQYDYKFWQTACILKKKNGKFYKKMEMCEVSNVLHEPSIPCWELQDSFMDMEPRSTQNVPTGHSTQVPSETAKVGGASSEERHVGEHPTQYHCPV